jgi:hypothetical protein
VNFPRDSERQFDEDEKNGWDHYRSPELVDAGGERLAIAHRENQNEGSMKWEKAQQSREVHCAHRGMAGWNRSAH